MTVLTGVAHTTVCSYYVPKFEIQVENKNRQILQDLYEQMKKKDQLVGSNAYKKQKSKNQHHNKDVSENSLSSTDTMDASYSYSATERGYMTDVSDSASPTGRRNIVSPTRRRMKCSDTNLNRKNGQKGGSYSDSEDENPNSRVPHRFERKPPKSKSSRRREKLSLQETRHVPVTKRHSYDPTKRNSYDPTKRFSWTDSGISSSIGTGPNTMKSMYSESIPASIVHLEKMRDKNPVPSLENVVGDTCNAVNELKDLQISIRKAKLEHNSQKNLTKTNSLNSPYHNYYSNSSRPLSQTSIDRNYHMEIRRSDSTPIKRHSTNEDIFVENKRENKRRSHLYENLCVLKREDTIEEEDKIIPKENIDTRPLPPYPGTPEDRTKDIDEKEDEANEKEIENEDKLLKQLSTTSTKSVKNKGLFKGLRKVFKTKSAPPLTTKDVTSEFSFEKRRIDEDTLKEFHTITTKFRNEVKYLQNMSIDDLDQTKTVLDEENIQNILLDQLTSKPNKNLSFLQRMFGRSKSYKAAKPLKKTKNTKSLCDSNTKGQYDTNTLPLSLENGSNDKKQKNENEKKHNTLNNDNFSNDESNTIKTNSLQTIKNESNCNSFRTSSRTRKTCTLSTKGDSCLKHSFCSLSPNEESFIENKRYTISSKSEYSKNNTDERHHHHHRRPVDDYDIDSVKSGGSSNKLLRARSLSHMRAAATAKHEPNNEPFPKQISINLHNQVHSFSSSDILGGVTPNNCDIFSSDCEECAYSDYLDFLQFRRFRKSNQRCERYCRYPRETYDDNGYGTYTDYTDHHCACTTENSSVHAQRNNHRKEYNGHGGPGDKKNDSGSGNKTASYGTYV